MSSRKIPLIRLGENSTSDEYFFQGGLPSYLLTLRVKKNEALSKASIRTFQLKSRYKDYSGQAYHLAKVMRGMSARLDMHREILECETSIEDYLEFEPEDYKTVPYGKARICIAKQFGALPD
ncbi:hypothetical protein [Pseudomonas aeruginosa]